MPAVSVNGPAEFVSTIPVLLGFHPHRCLVLGSLHGQSDVGELLHVDIEEAARPTAADQLVTALKRHEPDRLLIAVIDDRVFDPAQPTRHQQLVDALTAGARAAGITIQRVVWASGTTAEAIWCTRDDHGTVPDPRSSTLAASLAVAGHVTYPSREALAASLEPDDPEAAASRVPQLDKPDSHLDRRQAVDAVCDAITRAAQGHLPETDNDFVALGRGLEHDVGRDTALVLTVENPQATRELWVSLTRALPAPWRARAAVLVAVAAYLTGLGALADVALEAADRARPEHRLARLLRQAFNNAIHPDELRRAIDGAKRWATDEDEER
ncbi:DUF4192 domain-containing protein [Prauserella flavalba]|uniref:DUF4192 domain-containing protein n=1 Tax=Prauserella flavalba TaxID=1477506 RepID=UPI0036E01503